MTKLLPIVLLFAVAAAAYLLGGCNGALLVSSHFFHEDIRKNGSGNAGLTNFYRVYGAKYLLPVLLIDIVKTVLALVAGSLLFGAFGYPELFGKYWAGFWVCVGHALPCFFDFRGGKGILCAGTMLWMLDWRIAVCAYAVFALTLALTGYVSLSSILACISFPVATFFVFRGIHYSFLFACAISALAIAAHSGNIRRLLAGKENKFRLRETTEKGKSK